MKSIFKRIGIFTMMLSICISVVACGNKSENNINVDTKAQDKGKIEAENKGKTEVVSLETLKAIPKFKCTDVDGKEVSNEIFKDSKLTLVNLWGTWCSPCVGELPDLGDLYKEMKGKNVNVVGVVEDGMKNEEAVKEILKKTNVTFTNIVPDEKFYDDFMTLCGTYPTSMLVDSSGNIVGEVISGVRTKEQYKKLIEDALKNLK